MFGLFTVPLGTNVLALIRMPGFRPWLRGVKNSLLYRGRDSTNNVVSFPTDTNATVLDDFFMDLAIRQAETAMRCNEVPIGAVIVRSIPSSDQRSSSASSPSLCRFEIVGAAHNKVETLRDASAHAELLCLREASRRVGNWRLGENATLYSTLEPCPMCLSAANAFRVGRVVYGAKDHRLGAIESYVRLEEVAPKHPYHPDGWVTTHGGVREEECGSMMRAFFKRRRAETKKKRKR